MSDAATGNSSKKAEAADWRRFKSRTDAEIRHGLSEDEDVGITDDAFWKDAVLVDPGPKRIVTMRLDADLLEWFRRGKGYQTRINAVLRAYMRAMTAK
jgi:uncharacterized protein (DUF4415 family)